MTTPGAASEPRRLSTHRYKTKTSIHDKYEIVGFISSGTYGRVYKAIGKLGQKGEFAIKKFKPDRDGDAPQYTGLSQSAIREISLCTELCHANVVQLVEVILEDKCVFMVFEFTEHDLLQVIHHHTQYQRTAIPAPVVKSIMFQLLNGLLYLHTNWVLHRDLKPANILITAKGAVRIGDLGLARIFRKPLTSLFQGDKVVVTIWYRAPELLLGSKHYAPSVDMWAVGCIFAELLSLRPIFKGEEIKMDGKKGIPFQRNQMLKIIEILGLPNKKAWPQITSMPEYPQFQALLMSWLSNIYKQSSGLEAWYYDTLKAGYSDLSREVPGREGLDLLSRLFTYDPEKRLTAREALQHPYFTTGSHVTANCFEGFEGKYPKRKVAVDDKDFGSARAGTSRKNTYTDNAAGRSSKRRKGA
ncbi:hypothetical protein KEM56_005345 [Ascosphaera pollenicola]|nr:hypothetical protein KEM56_005345 [Ascosphaera pollenicola]